MKNVPRPSVDQRNAYVFVMQAQAILGTGGHGGSCCKKRGREFFFIDDPGGMGKIFSFTIILASIRSQSRMALAVASSDVGSTLLPGGPTAHSQFKIPINVNPNGACPINKQSGLALLLLRTDLNR